jgi:hypothetical protein
VRRAVVHPQHDGGAGAVPHRPGMAPALGCPPSSPSRRAGRRRRIPPPRARARVDVGEAAGSKPRPALVGGSGSPRCQKSRSS